MRTFALILLFSISSIAVGQNFEKVRTLYLSAVQNEDSNNQLLQLLGQYDQNDVLIQGYRAVAVMMQAQYTLNPYSKYKFYNNGKSLLESSISKEKSNVELRYLRLCVQVNLPDFLDYKDNIDEDIRAIRAVSNDQLSEQLRAMYNQVLDEYDRRMSSQNHVQPVVNTK